MSTPLATILAGPVNIAELRKVETNQTGLAGVLFSNFLHYARKNWKYSASSADGGDALLSGRAVASPCGGLAKALKHVFEVGLDLKAKEVEFVTIPGYVWTKATYACFDARVIGNIVKAGEQSFEGNGCMFSQHFYLKFSNMCYDPCLATAYAVPQACVKELFKTPVQYDVGEGIHSRKVLHSLGENKLALYMPKVPAEGFQGSWKLISATKNALRLELGRTLEVAFNARGSAGLKLKQFYDKLP